MTIAQIIEHRALNSNLAFTPQQSRYIAFNLEAILAHLLSVSNVTAVLQCCRGVLGVRSPFLQLTTIVVEPLCPLTRQDLASLSGYLPALLHIRTSGPGTTWSWSSRPAHLTLAYHVTPRQVINAPPNLFPHDANTTSVTMVLGPRPPAGIALGLITHRALFQAAGSWAFVGGDLPLTTLVGACIRAKVSVPASLSGPFSDCLADMTDFLRHAIAARLRILQAVPRRASITAPQFGHAQWHRVRLTSLELSMECTRATTLFPTWEDVRGYGTFMWAAEKSVDSRVEFGRGPLSILSLNLCIPLDVAQLDIKPQDMSADHLSNFVFRCAQLASTHRSNMLKTLAVGGRCSARVKFVAPRVADFWETAGQSATGKVQGRLDATLSELRAGTYKSPREIRREERRDHRRRGKDRTAEYSESTTTEEDISTAPSAPNTASSSSNSGPTAPTSADDGSNVPSQQTGSLDTTQQTEEMANLDRSLGRMSVD